MQDHVRSVLDRVAARQHGVVATHQLRAAGLSALQIRDCRRSTSVEVIGPHVLRAIGSAENPRQTAMVGVLDAGPGAVLSHQAAAALWELPGFGLDPVHVLADRSGQQHRASPYLAVLHRPRLLTDDQCTVLDGIPVSTPARTIFDLANSGLRPGRVERALDSAWAMNLVNLRVMQRTLRVLARRGRRGVALMRQLIAERETEYRPPESGLEARFRELCRLYDVPEMRRQVDVGDAGQWIGRVDFLATDLPLICRIQSARYHSALVDAREDARRNELLRAEGFCVLEITDVDVWQRPGITMRRVRDARLALRYPSLAPNPSASGRGCGQ